MKKFDKFKTLQLILTLLLAAVSLCIILTDRELYQLVGRDPQIRSLCILLWLSFVLSFVSIFIDFSMHTTLKRDYRELDFAVSSDPVSGIANRYSCDVLIEKYMDKELPHHIGCIMLDLTNLQETNQTFGHVAGNLLIRDFSEILLASSRDLCFVGRNGGNIFMAFFEECTEQKLTAFLDRMAVKVERHNKTTSSQPIKYRYGMAFNEQDDVYTVTDLIALSSRRIRDEDNT